jgi:hypothetical protein
MIMLLLRTFARKLRDDAMRLFSLNANTVPIGDSAPESKDFRRYDLLKAISLYYLELGHDRGGDKSWVGHARNSYS